MSRIFQGTALACCLTFALLSPGCAEDNEKSAAIKGAPPADTKTEQERLDAMRGAGAGAAVKGSSTAAPTAYPGTKKR
jgi:hypothetical protein